MTVDAVNLQSVGVQLQVVANLLTAMPDHDDESLETLLDKTRDEPPENRYPAAAVRTLGNTAGVRQQAWSGPRRQQEGCRDRGISRLGSIQVRRKLPITATSPEVQWFMQTRCACLCPEVSWFFRTVDSAQWPHIFLTDVRIAADPAPHPACDVV